MTIPICLLLLISEQSNFSEQRASGLLTHVVDQLINNDLNNVILTIRYRETSTYDDKSDPDDTGTIIYGRVGDTYFVDSDFSSSPRVSSENRRRVPFIYQRQIFHESNKPNLKLQYSVHGGQKNVKHISADPTEDDNTKILAVADRARLVPTLTSWFPLGIKIIDIENKYQPVEILEDNSKTMYSYKTPYGSLTVLIDHHNSQPSLVNISLVKGSNDLVSPRTKDPVRINQIKTNVFGTVGYDRIEYNLKFGYGIVDGVRTLTSIEDSNTTRSGNRKHTVTCTWEIVSRRACNDPVELRCGICWSIFQRGRQSVHQMPNFQRLTWLIETVRSFGRWTVRP